MKLRLVMLCTISILTLYTAKGQVVAGIRANGRVMVHGDTINVCRGSSILYESLAQGTSTINWRFNNGSPNTMAGAGPFSIAYNTNGFDTTFQIAGSGAFSDSMFIIVRVFDLKPNVGFGFNSNNVCGNETIQFTNTSSIGEPLSYYWDFGDGNTSVEQDPSHQFLSAIGSSGSEDFQVKLIVTNSSFCVDSITQTITILTVPDAEMGSADPNVTMGSSGDLPAFRICDGETSYNFRFTNESTTIPINASYTISWGDGSADTVFNSWPAGSIISHRFPEGSSRMRISVTGTSGCIGIKDYVVYVGSFPYGRMPAIGNNEICVNDSLSFSITDTENNSPGTSYYFYINDGSESQFYRHPIPAVLGHRFGRNSCNNLSDDGSQVIPNSFGAYLLVQNPCGVASASVVPIYVSGRPKALINASSRASCAGNTISFINTSGYGNTVIPTGPASSECATTGKNVWSISPATGFTIINGQTGSLNGNNSDQSSWTDGSDSLDVQFLNAGVYTVKIYVANEKCGIDSTVTTVCIRTPPQASFSMSKKHSCGPSTIDFTNTSTPSECSTLNDQNKWTIAYSDPLGCADPVSPTHTFVNGTSDASHSPSITFAAVGQYIIELQVAPSNPASGCAPGLFRDTFYVSGPHRVTMDDLPATCVSNDVLPMVIVSGCYTRGPYVYQWSIENGSPANSTDSLPGPVTFSIPGNHLLQVIVTDSACMVSDTASKIVEVAPLPDVRIAADTSVCSGETIMLGGPAVPGVVYRWWPATGLSDSTSSNPEVLFFFGGPADDSVITYYLSASQGNNCEKTDSVSIRVRRNPVVTVNPAVVSICQGGQITITATGADSYSWTPGTSLNDSTTSMVVATPSVNTTYYVTGLLSNGCSARDSATVSVFPAPSSDFTLAPNKICTGQAISVTNLSSGAAEYEWQWGDGSSSTFESGQHTYNAPGNYDVHLITRSSGISGFTCTDTAIQQVEVLNKIQAQIDVAPGPKCAPYILKAEAANAEMADLVEWVIYDSSAIPGTFQATGPTTTHVFYKPGSYAVQLVVHTASGCTDTTLYSFKVSGTPVSTFNPRNNSVCGTDTTIAYVAETSSDGNEAINYTWYVNDNLVGNSNPFSYHFISPPGSTTSTTFTVRLLAQNTAGCGETSVTGTVELNPVPVPIISVSPALVQQQPNYEFGFKDLSPANPNRIFTWHFGDQTQQTRQGQQVSFQYNDTGTYQVKLEVADFATGCLAADSVRVAILYVAGYVQVPNAICPGCSNRGVRYFLPLAKGLKKYRLTIYTTLGQKIFETTSLDAEGSPNVPWDGTLNGKPLQQDVYSWQIEASFTNGSEWKGMLYPGKTRPVKAGFITVIK